MKKGRFTPLQIKKIKTMNNIKNIHLINNLLNDEKLENLEASALSFRRFARITFKILKVEENALTIEARQGKNPNGNYADKKRLIEIVDEVFKGYFPNYLIHKRPSVYVSAVTEIVDDKWIRHQMNKNKIGNKKLVKDLGIGRSDISAIINGHVNLSVRTKGLFYYYFKSLGS